MTEPTSPFGGVGVAEPTQPITTDMAPPVELAGSADNRRKLLLVGAVVGVVILAAAAYFLFFNKSSGSNGDFAPIAKGHPAAAGHSGGNQPTAGKAGAATMPVTLPNVAKRPAGRDPFKALVQPPVAAVAPASTTAGQQPQSTSDSSTTSIPSQGGSSTTSGSTTTPSGGTGTSQAGSGQPKPPVVATPQWVELDSVTGRTATFTVGYADGTTRTFKSVALDKTFGKDFKLLGVQDHYVTVQFGDGEPFDVHPGAKNKQSL